MVIATYYVYQMKNIMKKVIMPLAMGLTIASLTACGGANSSESATDSSSATKTETSTSSSSTDGEGSTSTTTITKSSYTDLASGSQFKIEKDPSTGYYVNAETHKPVNFYFDPETSDTFDMKGRVVNMALIHASDGSYTVNEDKVKVQADGDIKIKEEGTDNKMKIETNGDTKVKTDDYKEKTKGDNYKYKDDSTTIKVKDGKVKVKSN
jgi:hypothetical protein